MQAWTAAAWMLIGIGGALAFSAPPRQAPVIERHTRTIDDFRDGDRHAASGAGWISIADDLMGGGSQAELEVIEAGAGSAGALRVSGELAPSGFAGAWVALDGRGRATDLRDFAGIRLRLRGNGAVQVGLRAGPMPGFNYMAAVAADPDWKLVEVPFDRLRTSSQKAPDFDRSSARWLGIAVGAGRTGHFEYEIDDVELYSGDGEARLRVQEGPTMAALFQLSPISDLPAQHWTELARDPADDGRQKRLPDATALASCDGDGDRVWFRIALSGPVPRRWLGLNLALDVDGDPANGMAWWGTNRAFRFDRLVTVYGSATGSGYQGIIGAAEAAEVQAGSLAGSAGERVQIVVDEAGSALALGIPRRILEGKGPLRVLAAVGSAFQHNDDVPDSGAVLIGR